MTEGVLIAILVLLGSQGAATLYSKIISPRVRGRKELKDEMDIFKYRIEQLKELNEELRGEITAMKGRIEELKEENEYLKKILKHH